MKTKIETTSVVHFEDALYIVQAHDAQGREYTFGDLQYPIVPMDRTAAHIFARQVQEAGEIDPEVWTCRIPYGTDAWLLDGMEDRYIEDERM